MQKKQDLFHVGAILNHYTKHIFICTNQKIPGKVCCAQTGGKPFFDHMKQTLQSMGLYGPGKIRVSTSGCLGRCALGPAMVIYPEGVWYRYDSVEDINEIIDVHLVLDQRVSRLLLVTEASLSPLV